MPLRDTQQQVDLYLPEFRPRFDPLALSVVTSCAAGILVLALLTGLLQWWGIRHLSAEVAQQQQAKILLQQAVTTLQKQIPPSQSAQLQQVLAGLQDEIREREQIRQVISGQELGNRRGFSGLLQGLAAHTDGQLYLRHFSVSDGGRRMSLQGVSREAGQVPAYIDALRQEPAFVAVVFGPLQITRNQSGALMNFSLGSEGAK